MYGHQAMFKRQAVDANRLPASVYDGKKLALTQKPRRDESEIQRKHDSSKRAFKYIVLTMLFQSTTEPYAFMFYVIPYILEEYSQWTMIAMNMLIWFIGINIMANWFCVMLCKPIYSRTKDNPNLKQQAGPAPDQFPTHIQQSPKNYETNGHCVYDISTKKALPWQFCEKCATHVPFRAHHCDVCKACILKRDHHCYIIGNCIGFNNQRYWVLLTFYLILNWFVCGYFLSKYVRNVVWPNLSTWSDVIFPLTIWRSVFGDISTIHGVFIVQLYLDFAFGLLALIYFSMQLTVIIKGKTLYEIVKRIPIKSTNSFNRNMKSVFGNYWLLNFLFPMTLIFRQTDDGLHWDGIKIDHKGVGRETSEISVSYDHNRNRS